LFFVFFLRYRPRPRSHRSQHEVVQVADVVVGLVVATSGHVHQRTVQLVLHRLERAVVKLLHRRVLNLVDGVLDDVHGLAIVLAEHGVVDGAGAHEHHKVIQEWQGVLGLERHVGQARKRSTRAVGVERRAESFEGLRTLESCMR
jgi:hypothetical protein